MNRLYIFLIVFVSFGILEFFFSYRDRIFNRRDRWPANILLAGFPNIILRVLFPVGLSGLAQYVEKNEWGLFNKVSFPYEAFWTLVLLDFFIWFQHYITHKIPFLWKLHRVHHTDLDLDVSSALRFHPLEIIFSILFKSILIIIFGFKAEVVILFEILLNSMAIFNHSNLYLPLNLEKKLRWLVVTPQMHIIHHSENRKYSDSNYGFNLSIWDRIAKTYFEKDEGEKIGQKKYKTKEDQKLMSLLVQPFNS